MGRIRKLLLASVVLLPINVACVGYSLYLEIMGIQSTPYTSWAAIVILSVYSIIKLDIKDMMEKRMEQEGIKKERIL